MPYTPRPATTALCAHCSEPFQKKHASKKYCSNTCNVKASYARNGRPGEPRATRADLERTLAKVMEMLKLTPELATSTQPAAPKSASKALPAKPAAKAAVKQAPETAKTATKPAAPAAKAAATKPAKKITNSAPPAPTAKAAAKARFAKLAQKASDEEKFNQDHYGGRDPREIYRR